MKRFFLVLLMFALFSAAAMAETEYAVSPANLDTDALLMLTFGDQRSNVELVSDQTSITYGLPNSDGPPFFGINTLFPAQSGLSCFTAAWLSGNHRYAGFTDNVEPSGESRGSLTRARANAQAESMMQLMKLSDYRLQSITAYGKDTSAVPEYAIAFTQTLQQLPVYWSAISMTELPVSGAAAEYIPPPQSNRLLFVLSDEGLVRLDGAWSSFTPVGADLPLLSVQQAISGFATENPPMEQLELCYLMHFDGKTATASPAYRYQNSFVHALTGIRLQ